MIGKNVGETNVRFETSTHNEYWSAFDALPLYVQRQLRELSLDVSPIPLLKEYRRIKRDFPDAIPREVWNWLMDIARKQLAKDHEEIQFRDCNILCEEE